MELDDITTLLVALRPTITKSAPFMSISREALKSKVQKPPARSQKSIRGPNLQLEIQALFWLMLCRSLRAFENTSGRISNIFRFRATAFQNVEVKRSPLRQHPVCWGPIPPYNAIETWNHFWLQPGFPLIDCVGFGHIIPQVRPPKCALQGGRLP